MKTITFVIPVYNEEKRLDKTIKALKEVKLPAGLKLEKIIFVNDGSTDKTVQVIEKVAKSKTIAFPISLLTYKQNKGKGFAIRQGMRIASSDYNLFFDADMSTPLSELKKFMPFMDKNIPVLVGTRKNGKSTVVVHQPRMRELLGKGFTKITQISLNCWVTDFTCGFKAFSRKATLAIFSQSTINGWGYDAEILYLATKQGFSLQEIPVLWSNDERTKVKLYKAIPQTLSEIVTILYTHSLKQKSATFPGKTIFARFQTRLMGAK